jgi:hypothetical protein
MRAILSRARTAAAAVVALVAVAAAPAAAQDPCPGRLSSTALAPVPAGAVFGATLGDDNPAQRMLRETLYAALRRAGRQVGQPPTHVLSWRGSLGREGAGGAAGIDLLQRDLGRFQDSDDLGWMQGVPSRGERRAQGASGAPRLNAVVELRERSSGRVLWTASLSCDVRTQDRAALAEGLVAAVVPAIGRTLSGRPF